MSTITKEWLQRLIRAIDSENFDEEEIVGWVNSDEIMELARIALASLEAEPVAYMWDSDRKDVDAAGYYRPEHKIFAESSVKRYGGKVVALYTAPPAPVVPPEYVAPVSTPSNLGYEAGWNACRAAMLQGAENAWSPTTMQTAPALDSSAKIAESPSGNSPVIPDGWVNCSERMPKKGERDIWLFDGEFVHHGYIWDGHDFVDWNEECESITGITHWMKMALPAAPQQEVK